MNTIRIGYYYSNYYLGLSYLKHWLEYRRMGILQDVQSDCPITLML